MGQKEEKEGRKMVSFGTKGKKGKIQAAVQETQTAVPSSKHVAILYVQLYTSTS